MRMKSKLLLIMGLLLVTVFSSVSYCALLEKSVTLSGGSTTETFTYIMAGNTTELKFTITEDDVKATIRAGTPLAWVPISGSTLGSCSGSIIYQVEGADVYTADQLFVAKIQGDVASCTGSGPGPGVAATFNFNLAGSVDDGFRIEPPSSSIPLKEWLPLNAMNNYNVGVPVVWDDNGSTSTILYTAEDTGSIYDGTSELATVYLRSEDAGQFTIGATQSLYEDPADAEVNVVKVDKVQYEEPGGAWNDISGTLYVLKGSSVTFKAVPDPVVSWPSGKPVWGGTSGASGSDETKVVTFNTLSSTTTDYKTLTTICGNTNTVNIVVYELTGVLTPDDNFTGRSLDDYGVEETVTLSHKTTPVGITGLPLKWKKFSGKGTVTVSSYDAEAIPGSVTLRMELTSGPNKGDVKDYGTGKVKDYVKTVVAPVNRFIRHATLTGAWHIQGQHSVKFKGQSYLDPKDVSFTNIKRREGASTAATGTGLFLFANGYVHPIGAWFTPANPNITTGCYVVSDTTGFGLGAGGVLGDSGLMSNYSIDYEYKGDDGVTRKMGAIDSSKKVEIGGDSKAKKGSVGWVSKHFGDANSTF